VGKFQVKMPLKFITLPAEGPHVRPKVWKTF